LGLNNANIYYGIHGRGDPLLMIQGWGPYMFADTVIEFVEKKAYFHTA
jgi:hypothetical protein